MRAQVAWRCRPKRSERQRRRVEEAGAWTRGAQVSPFRGGHPFYTRAATMTESHASGLARSRLLLSLSLVLPTGAPTLSLQTPKSWEGRCISPAERPKAKQPMRDIQIPALSIGRARGSAPSSFLGVGGKGGRKGFGFGLVSDFLVSSQLVMSQFKDEIGRDRLCDRSVFRMCSSIFCVWFLG